MKPVAGYPDRGILFQGVQAGRVSLVDCPSCDGGQEYPRNNCEGCLGEGKVEWDRTHVQGGQRVFKPGLEDLRKIRRRRGV